MTCPRLTRRRDARLLELKPDTELVAAGLGPLGELADLDVLSGALLGLAAVVSGHRALATFKTCPGQFAGKGTAVAGLILGYIDILFSVFLACLLPVILNMLAEVRALSGM